jgi:hypothetical protein
MHYTRNALLRCERLATKERLACTARMQGAGTVRGSAASGGIYRELTTTEPAKAQACGRPVIRAARRPGGQKRAPVIDRSPN